MVNSECSLDYDATHFSSHISTGGLSAASQIPRLLVTFFVLNTGPGVCLETTNASTSQKATIQDTCESSDYSCIQTLVTEIKNMNNVYCDLHLPPYV